MIVTIPVKNGICPVQDVVDRPLYFAESGGFSKQNNCWKIKLTNQETNKQSKAIRQGSYFCWKIRNLTDAMGRFEESPRMRNVGSTPHIPNVEFYYAEKKTHTKLYL